MSKLNYVIVYLSLLSIGIFLMIPSNLMVKEQDWTIFSFNSIKSHPWLDDTPNPSIAEDDVEKKQETALLDCNCTVTQGGFSVGVNSLIGNVDIATLYGYVPTSSSSGLGGEDKLRFFMYEDSNTGDVGLFIIMDVPNDDDGGSGQIDIECLPPTAFIANGDEPNEFNGAPPSITGNWNWPGDHTDGGTIAGIGCGTTFDIYPNAFTGIDGVEWLTGDLANPTIIPLPSFTTRIRVDCGGTGVCCPEDFDVTVSNFNATCPNDSDGRATVTPNFGTPPFTYLWPDGQTTNTVNNLAPGTYTVLITDAEGCTDEATVNIGFNFPIPFANPTQLQGCSTGPTAIFDLSQAEGDIDLSGIGNINWFTDAGLTDPIFFPFAYESGTATVYAVVDNGNCFSDPAPVELIVNQAPFSAPGSLNACDIGFGQGLFNLNDLDAQVGGGGIFQVQWYEDINLSSPITTPFAYVAQGPIATVYAVIFDGLCFSDPAPVTLFVDPAPEACMATLDACNDGSGQASFDLTELDDDVNCTNLNNVFVNYYQDVLLQQPITDPTNYESGDRTIYATIDDGFCESPPVEIELNILAIPSANGASLDACDEGNGEATFNLTDVNNTVNGNSGDQVNWYMDANGTMPIGNPFAFLTGSTTVYASVFVGDCESVPAPVTIMVFDLPEPVVTSDELCDEGNGQATFNLLGLNGTVSGGAGTVSWFSDANGNNPINNPGSYQTASTIVYVTVTSSNNCESLPLAISLDVVDIPVGTSTELRQCDTGNGQASFDLTTANGTVSGGTGIVNWFSNAAGTTPINNPFNFTSGETIVYAVLTLGNCTSDPIAVDLEVIDLLVANAASDELCDEGNGQATFDLTGLNGTVNTGGTGVVNWFSDANGTIPINNPDAYLSGTTIVYATIIDGGCESLPVAVNLDVLDLPTFNATSDELCDEGNGQAIFDLTSLEGTINGGTGTVNWYANAGATIDINTPDSYQSATTTVYATVTDGACESLPVPVDLTVIELPTVNTAEDELCDEGNNEATFDLTSLEGTIYTGTGTITWYEDDAQTTVITGTNAYTTPTTTVYVIVQEGNCLSEVVEVDLEVLELPTTNTASLETCDNGNGEGTFNLVSLDNAINNTADGIEWYSDAAGTIPIADPTNFESGNTTVYAVAVRGTCASAPVAVDLTVALEVQPTITCAFVSPDSIGFQWGAIAPTYEISYTINNGAASPVITITENTFGVGGLSEGDEVVITVAAIDPQCPNNPASTHSCITEPCPDLSLTFDNIDSTYCSDDDPIVLEATPSGGTFSGVGVTGDTFDPSQISGTSMIYYDYIDPTNGCDYMDSVEVTIVEPLIAPTVSCLIATTNSITFEWTDVGSTEYQVEIRIEGSLASNFTTTELQATFDGLDAEEEIEITVIPLGEAPCGNGPGGMVSCTSEPCPATTLAIDFLDDAYCTDVGAIQLPDIYPGGVYSGPGVTGLIFSPADANTDTVTITFNYTDSLTNCAYEISGITLVAEPLEAPSVTCTEATPNSVSFSWSSSSDTAFYNYNYSINGGLPLSFGPSTDTTLLVSGLTEGDEVTLRVEVLGTPPCGNSPIDSSVCVASNCPPLALDIPNLESNYCANTLPFTLVGDPVGGSFSGPGVSGDTFDPGSAGLGEVTITYTFTDVDTDCTYEQTFTTEIIDPLPIPNISCDNSSTTTTQVGFSWEDLGVLQYEITYSINMGAPLTEFVSQTTFLVDGLMAGDEVTIVVIALGEDPCGNSEPGTQSCVAQACPEISLTFTTPEVFCFDDDATELQADVIGASGPVSFEWSGDGVSSNGFFLPNTANIGENTINVSFEDSGCSYDTSFTIRVNPKPIANFELEGNSCLDSTITVTFSGTASANATLDWDLNEGTQVSGDLMDSFEVQWSAANTYVIELTVTDQGCVSDPFSVPVDIIAPIEAPEISCGELDEKSVVFNWDAVPGATDYIVTSSTGTGERTGTSFIVDNLLPATEVTIEVEVMTNNPCGSVFATQTCSVPPCPEKTVSLSGPQEVCRGGNAELMIVFSDDQGSTYNLTYRVEGTENTVVIESNGTLPIVDMQMNQRVEIVSFFDINKPDCIYNSTESIDIPIVEPPVAGAAMEKIESCIGIGAAIQLNDILEGEDAGGTWSGDNVGSSFDPATGNLDLASLSAGTFQFTYTVAGGTCPDDEAVVDVEIFSNPIAEAGESQELTCNIGTVSLGSGLSTAGDSITYLWTSSNPDAMISNPDDLLVDVSQPGVYTLTVTNENGCQATDEVEVTVSKETPIVDAQISPISCFESNDGSIAITNIEGGVPPYQLQIDGQDLGNQTVINNLSPGEYSLVVTDQNGCFSELLFDLDEPDALRVEIVADLGEDNSISFGDSIPMEARINKQIPIQTVEWTPELPDSAIVWIRPEFTTTYSVTVVDINGCNDSDDLTVFVRRDRPVYIPNAFSPDEDGVNEIFYIQSGEQVVQIQSFFILNRWGETMFEASNFQPNDPAFGWNGEHRGQIMNPGVYVYFAEVEFNDGEVIQYAGDVTLMR